MAKGLFDIPERSGKSNDIALAKKLNTKVTRKPTATVKGGSGILGRVSTIVAMVEQNLGKYADESIVIRDIDTLHQYIDVCIANNVISIDTETTGLDPMLDQIAGICIYTPNQKTAYIPLNHISHITQLRIENQLTVEEVKPEFQRIADHKIDVIMFNAPFDIRFLRNQVGVYLKCTWDCYLGARLLNENEGSGNNGLKKLHQKYVLDGVGDAFKFDDLFKGIPFTYIPINTGYLYASHDAIITYELYQYQKQYLYYDPTVELSDRNGLNGVSWVFFNIEMPIVEVVANMEDNGITFDMNYQHELSIKYNELLEQKILAFNEELSKIEDKITSYIGTHPVNKLSDPINIASSTQIAILLYDILKLESPDARNPRGTGVEILTHFDHPICKAILGYREVSKLLSTYIDKLPNCVNPNDGRIHCKFNQYGADTGRFSSNDPNLQNIPSHNKDIRKMFTAKDGYVLMSSDFSQQEPKCLAALCRQQGDSQMYDTFMAGKDLYSEIASKAFNVPYEDCLEFYLDENGNKTGQTNKDGKARRTQAKSILLGVLYGRGTPSIAEQLGCSVEKAQEIKDSVFRGFPAIKQFEEDSLSMAHNLGYVTTVCGRKRRLPDLMLDEFEFEWATGCAPTDDILDFSGEEYEEQPIPMSLVNKYLRQLNKAKFNRKRDIIDRAREDGLVIIDNGKKIADSTRQCVNARIQGSAADLTKIAMIALDNSEELKQLGFKTLIPVHDEIIAECPLENAQECAKLLAETMSKSAEQILQMPIKCDVEVTREWYGEAVEL